MERTPPLGRRDALASMAAVVTSFALGDLGCGRANTGPGRDVSLYAAMDPAIAEPVLRSIEVASDLRVRGVFDADEAKAELAHRVIAEGSSPRADVFWSSDPLRISTLSKKDLTEPYLAATSLGAPAAFRPESGAWTGVAARSRVLILNRSKIGSNRPLSVKDLANPEWRDRCAIASPAAGLSAVHAAALAVAWGDDKLRAFLGEMKGNGARIAPTSAEVRKLVVSGEVAFGLVDNVDAAQAVREAQAQVIHPDQQTDLGTFMLPTVLVQLRGAPHAAAAHDLIDALASTATERRLCETGAFVPLRASVQVAEGLRRATDVRAMSLDFAAVADALERLAPWLQTFAGG